MDIDDLSPKAPLRPRPEPESEGPRFVTEPPIAGQAPRITAGVVIACRMFDVAQEIDLPAVERLLKSEAARLKLVRENSQFLELRNPPVSVVLGMREVTLAHGRIQAELRARLFDHGALSFVLQVPIPSGTGFEALVALADEIYDAVPIDLLCRAEAIALCNRLGPALRGPHLWEGEESYTVIFVKGLEGAPEAEEVLARCDVARLLLGERSPVPLSAQQRGDVLRHVHSYLANDLAVIDWNSAFVYEPSGSSDIPDILEIANAQLLEMRYYDALLDRELDDIYDEINRGKRRWWSLFSSRYGKLRRRILALTLEVGEFTERVENSLKIIGDFYLARVYQTALRRFRISDWEQSVFRKEASIAQVYALLKSEVDMDRLLWLEIAVVLLILGELIQAFH